MMNQINVVPYIDVMLVLLVIFMVAPQATPTGSIELPSVGQASQTPAKPIEVIVKADGKLALRDMESASPKETAVTRDTLISSVRELQAGDASRPLVVAGDKAVRYEEITRVVGALQNNGFTRIGLLVEQAGQSGRAER
ncbi:Putative biopolymer transport protein ExbD/TolR [Methyloversatilis universalis FAM5]|uniref:Biopolymer transport protein ExbD/TolR n=1 Tax=Methyloversatilis universalis (strain ATCC BAA-1314 / DSM 25237 / JCM 13912 / CCUG 52030 / FAM5) TaxID=1000565 RepID=F5RG01_METUF|nr:ExbD/TolR family protein [Methyloversatilis universalis]EGK70489.1 Putative biopolymer transport protein ExbD/TolR [Methyloversatilis universalis FAM5]